MRSESAGLPRGTVYPSARESSRRMPPEPLHLLTSNLSSPSQPNSLYAWQPNTPSTQKGASFIDDERKGGVESADCEMGSVASASSSKNSMTKSKFSLEGGPLFRKAISNLQASHDDAPKQLVDSLLCRLDPLADPLTLALPMELLALAGEISYPCVEERRADIMRMLLTVVVHNPFELSRQAALRVLKPLRPSWEGDRLQPLESLAWGLVDDPKTVGRLRGASVWGLLDLVRPNPPSGIALVDRLAVELGLAETVREEDRRTSSDASDIDRFRALASLLTRACEMSIVFFEHTSGLELGSVGDDADEDSADDTTGGTRGMLIASHWRILKTGNMRFLQLWLAPLRVESGMLLMLMPVLRFHFTTPFPATSLLVVVVEGVPDNSDLIGDLGRLFSHILISVHHHGVANAAQRAFMTLCSALATTKSSTLLDLWTENALSSISSVSIVRHDDRSAGTARILLSILNGLKKDRARQIEATRRVYDALALLVDGDREVQEAIQVSALDTVCWLKKDAGIGRLLPAEDIFLLAIRGLNSDRKPVQGASSLLYSRLLQRVVDAAQNPSDFFTSHPRLLSLVQDELEMSIRTVDSMKLTFNARFLVPKSSKSPEDVVPNLGPAVKTRARVFALRSGGIVDASPLADSVSVADCQGLFGALAGLREMAAANMASLVENDRLLKTCREYIALLPDAPGISTNPILPNFDAGNDHWKLTYSQANLLKTPSMAFYTRFAESIPTIAATVFDRFWLATERNTCTLTRALFVEVLARLVGHTCEKTASALRLMEIGVGLRHAGIDFLPTSPPVPFQDSWTERSIGDDLLAESAARLSLNLALSAISTRSLAEQVDFLLGQGRWAVSNATLRWLKENFEGWRRWVNHCKPDFPVVAQCSRAPCGDVIIATVLRKILFDTVRGDPHSCLIPAMEVALLDDGARLLEIDSIGLLHTLKEFLRTEATDSDVSLLAVEMMGYTLNHVSTESFEQALLTYLEVMEKMATADCQTAWATSLIRLPTPPSLAPSTSTRLVLLIIKLLVEDDEEVRGLACRFLARLLPDESIREADPLEACENALSHLSNQSVSLVRFILPWSDAMSASSASSLTLRATTLVAEAARTSISKLADAQLAEIRRILLPDEEVAFEELRAFVTLLDQTSAESSICLAQIPLARTHRLLQATCCFCLSKPTSRHYPVLKGALTYCFRAKRFRLPDSLTYAPSQQPLKISSEQSTKMPR
ncbi:hypothetical protein BDK51DRAFT_41998 [Blyttiomyces helicus]|uniref:DUF2428 domain-containing protein n=1 Tax=Blyttiomyces helicus TaxID=388810 RepID=A0A4P9WLU6_9FUNG|nr:hypothetical protein BDK51DRAFT_41998 [Blyttiomyces helicus]|eukprot:RKO93165.1 hypothetical protein BDK51DRAFT_41998 [Blyttiomyces helicus]